MDLEELSEKTRHITDFLMDELTEMCADKDIGFASSAILSSVGHVVGLVIALAKDEKMASNIVDELIFAIVIATDHHKSGLETVKAIERAKK